MYTGDFIYRFILLQLVKTSNKQLKFKCDFIKNTCKSFFFSFDEILRKYSYQ